MMYTPYSNMAPEKGGLGDYFSLGKAYSYMGLYLSKELIQIETPPTCLLQLY